MTVNIDEDTHINLHCDNAMDVRANATSWERLRSKVGAHTQSLRITGVGATTGERLVAWALN